MSSPVRQRTSQLRFFDFNKLMGNEAKPNSVTQAIVGISGRIGTGKTAISTALANRLDWTRVSLGDYVRAVAHERHIIETRQALEDLGQQLVESNVKTFCQNALRFVIGGGGWHSSPICSPDDEDSG